METVSFNLDDVISAAQHEKEMTRMETANRRWFIAFLIVLSMLFVTNAGWIVYENQFQDIMIEQEGYSDTGNNYLNGTGEMTVNGQSGEADN